jgi:hypothetical protein
MSAGRGAARFSLGAALALPTPVWPLARLAGADLAALRGSAGANAAGK